MRKYYVSVSDLCVSRDMVDVADEDVREVYLGEELRSLNAPMDFDAAVFMEHAKQIDCSPLSGMAAKEQE